MNVTNQFRISEDLADFMFSDLVSDIHKQNWEMINWTKTGTIEFLSNWDNLGNQGFPPWGDGAGDPPPHKILKKNWDLGNEPFVAILLWPSG